MTKLQKITLSISVVLMMLALTQKAYCFEDHCTYSIIDFLFGMFGIFIDGDENWSWFANPLLIFAWGLVKHSRVSLMLRILSTLLALWLLMFDEAVINEAGHTAVIVSYALGYWLWLGSHVVMVLGNAATVFNNRSRLQR